MTHFLKNTTMKYLATIFILLIGLAITDKSNAQNKDWTSSTISIPVSDLAKSVKWYKQMLKVEESISPAPGLTEFKINDKTWIQLFEVEKISNASCSVISQ